MGTTRTANPGATMAAMIQKIEKNFRGMPVKKAVQASVDITRQEIKRSTRVNLRQVSGKLERSFFGKVRRDKHGYYGKVESRHPGAALQDKGGVQRGQSGKLAIPLSPQAVVAKYPKKLGRKLHAIASKHGPGTLLVEFGTRGFKAHFLLKPEVRVPGSKYWTKAIRRSRPQIKALVGTAFKLSIVRRK